MFNESILRGIRQRRGGLRVDKRLLTAWRGYVNISIGFGVLLFYIRRFLINNGSL